MKIYEIWDKLIDLYWWIKDLPREIKWFYQRGKNGFADCDVWELSMYLSKLIDKSLEQVDKGCGYPITFKNRKEWDKTILQMRKGFKAYYDFNNTDYPVDQITKKWEKAKKELDTSLKLFSTYFHNLWS